MNSVPQYSLRWNNYVSHVTDAFNDLRLDNDLVDVTLCCDGGRIKAHKMLLSICSHYFKMIFKENPCQHPVIIFRNVKYEDLNAIVNFMYHGEVNIFQEQLESFLITAELLEVKGLTDTIEEDVAKEIIKDNITLDLSYKPIGTNQALNDIPQNSIIEEPVNLASSASRDQQNLFTILETVPEPVIDNNKLDSNPYFDKYKYTGDEMQIDNDAAIEDLSERNESALAKFRCQLCPKGFKHPTSLTLHKDSHAGKTQCPVCHRSFSRSYDMKSHLQRIHQGKQLTIKEIRYKPSSSN